MAPSCWWRSAVILLRSAEAVQLSAHVCPPKLRKQLKNIFLTKLNVDALRKSGECDTSKDNCGLPMKWGYLSIEDSAYDGIRAVCDTTKSDSCNA